MTGIEAPLAIASLALALPSNIDLCIKYGRNLQQKIGLFKDAESHTNLKAFVIQLVAGGLNDMLEFFKAEDTGLTASFTDELTELTRLLSTLLLKAINTFPPDSEAEHKETKSKLKFALYEARRINEVSKDLESWHERFRIRADIYVTYVLRPRLQPANNERGIPKGNSMTSRIDRILASRRNVTGPLLLDNVPGDRCHQLPNSSMWISRDEPSGSDLLLEYRGYEGTDQTAIDQTRQVVCKIATKLREVARSDQGILQCHGFSEEPTSDRFALHFCIPQGKGNPRSLRNILADPRNKERGKQHSLSDRVELAKALASAILYVHSFEFVHKNIRPENILVVEPKLVDMPSPDREQHIFPFKLGQPYLVGYDGARNEEAESHFVQTIPWQSRLYLSPERQDLTKDKPKKYKMKHDVYSLGVILLEIALWEDFANERNAYGRLFQKSADLPKILMQLTKRIPILLGNKYRDVVVSCLQELEDERTSQLLNDENGIVVGMAYIEQVMNKLEEISL